MKAWQFTLLIGLLFASACTPARNETPAAGTATAVPTATETATTIAMPPTQAITSTVGPTQTSAPVPPLAAHTWTQSEPLITYTVGFGDVGGSFRDAYPLQFTLLATRDLYLPRWNESLKVSEMLTAKLSRQATCNLLNSIDQAGFFDYDPSTYVKDPNSWVRPIAGPDYTDISVHAWQANSVHLFALPVFLDPKMVQEMQSAWAGCSRCPEYPTILPAIRDTFDLLDQYQPPVALHALKPGRLGVWLYPDPSPVSTDGVVEWPLKSYTLAGAPTLEDTRGSPAMVLTGSNAAHVFSALHQGFDFYGTEVREGDKYYTVFARPLLPNEFNDVPLPQVSLSCSPSDGWSPAP